MPPRAPWRSLSAVLILLCGAGPSEGGCPHPCSCYVPSEVHCTFRSLASVPAGISTHVERINLGFNSIQALSKTSFAGLTKLELLMLHGNDIPTIPDGALSDLGALQVFKFSYNKLKVVTAQTLKGLWNLLRLHLDHNKIEFIQPQAFAGLTSLRLLHLEGNLLRQLHPDTFATFSFLGHFPLSTLRHLYLAENLLTGLPRAVLDGMPVLENLFLHSNPWACDCRLQWLLEWEAKAKGVLKCKKDKALEGGQVCPACSSPRALRTRELQKLSALVCHKPRIESPLRLNHTRDNPETEEEEEEEEEDDEEEDLEDAAALPSASWTISFNMSDAHGNTVQLACGVRRPPRLEQVQLNQTEAAELDVNGTVTMELECGMTREKYEQLWQLIAYYSEVPVKMRRDDAQPGQYLQDAADADALYYTGVRAHAVAEPAWILQPSLHLQLNRRQSSANRVRLLYSSPLALTVPAKDAQPRGTGPSWVMIEPGPTAHAVAEGATCQLSCNVKASESPALSWVLPGGSVLKAPYQDPAGRFSVLPSGGLRIRGARRADSGLYRCLAQVPGETDQLVHRVLVQPAGARPGGKVRKQRGERLTLPCGAPGAVPDAELSWVLPGGRMVQHKANGSRTFVDGHGALIIPELQPADAGYYTCLAVNPQGKDRMTVEVLVSRPGPRASKRGRRPVGGRAGTESLDDVGGSGLSPEDTPSTRGSLLHAHDQELFLHAKDEARLPAGRKGRRKMKPWAMAAAAAAKQPDGHMAESRRAFESRRRGSMASKSIHPQQWADILARVRGRTAPKGTLVPATAEASPVPTTPSLDEVPGTTGPVEASADGALVAEEEDQTPDSVDTHVQTRLTHTEGSSAPGAVPTSASPTLPPGTAESPLVAAPWAESPMQPPSSQPAVDASTQDNSRPPQRADDARSSPPPPGPTKSWTSEPDTVAATTQPWEGTHSSQRGLEEALPTAAEPPHTPRRERGLGHSVQRKTGGAKGHCHPREPPEKHLQPPRPSPQPATPQRPNPPPRHCRASRRHSRDPRRVPPAQAARVTLRPSYGGTPSPFPPWRTVTTKPRVSGYPPWAWLNKQFPTPRLPGVPPPRGPSARPQTPGKGSRVATAGTSVVFQPSNELPDVAGSRPPPRQRPAFPAESVVTFPSLRWTPPTPPATSRPPTSVPRRPGPSVHPRVLGQSIFHLNLGPPAPPWRTAATTSTSRPPSTRTQRPPPSPPTPPFQPSRNGPQGGFRVVSPGGAPASPFWAAGEKPQIITQFPHTASVSADGEVALPCQATGKPEPLVTWTKVSTGALITPSTRVGRFEVLRNGTLVIRGAQPQDRGQYTCTAQNLHGVDRRSVQLAVVTQQPHILASRLQDVTVHLGDSVSMQCLAQGTPAPHISWLFPDGRAWRSGPGVDGRVTLHENRTLSIRDAAFSDRGVYRCVASNAAGADSLAIRLHVAALPPVIQQDAWENITVAAGRSLHVHCTARAAPPPSVRWVLPDGTHVRPSQFVRGHLFVFPNGTLFIRHLAPRDSGRYECVAANLVGTARRTARLQVERAAAAQARITSASPERTDVRYGATLRLHCRASGEPWTRILWRLPSKQTADAFYSPEPRAKVLANGTLLLTSVTERDSGDYLCVARNPAGDDFAAVRVQVLTEPARIVPRDEADRQVPIGADLRVDCVASGLPNPEISWGLPDGSLVNSAMPADQPSGGDRGGGGVGQSRAAGGRAKRYVVFHNGTLYFNEVGPAEEGDYTCFAQNQAGRDEMRVRVRLLSLPAAIRNKTYSVLRVPYGDAAVVTCEAQGEPAPLLTWLSPSHRRIPASSDKYHIDARGTLLIHKARRADSGNYTCVVRNAAGEDRKTVWLHVQLQPPTINGHPNAVTTVREVATGGSRKLIDCRAEGVPTPRVLWAFPEGVVLPAPYYGNRITVHRNGTLDIRSPRPSDAVQLVCIGRNEGGEARMLVELTVLDAAQKPRFSDPSREDITALAGHTISLNCSATGRPPPTRHWLLPNGTELRAGQRLSRFYHAAADGRLHISGLAAADAGAYRCLARNAAGHAERLVALKVGLSPTHGPQYRNVVTIAHGETLKLHCSVPESGMGASVGRTGVGGMHGFSGQPSLSWTLPSGLTLDSPHSQGRFSRADNGTLTVQDASVFDRGTYVCRVDTGGGGPVVTTFPVIVIAYPPRITTQPAPVVYAQPGTSVKLPCMAVALPRAELAWELPDGARLTTGVQARLFGHRLLQPAGPSTLQHVTARDSGVYRCTARNVMGADSKTTYVQVY
ncbi:LOW QUALITY PROTEIN: matrix-remodeling-associated protein 5 [Sorex fumeus]|uniref:LOW QUALITY PROTEIN: matrix-remodeling-associated protein 5 n=1 Tax=Sorex fumeus TaxID=62283 RepID=UPI0024ADCAAC|nr:LOW QUALITY PROTEIN: matrix-remodeling-associated protein 5 [Sorex fumeus]